MITGELKSKVGRVWDAFWAGGIANPLEVMEQITFLLFIRRLDDLNTLAEKKARRTGKAEGLIFGPEQQDLRWSVFKNDEPALMYKTVSEKVFPFLRTLGGDGSTYGEHMKDARFTIPTPQLLSRVVDMLDDIPMADRDTNGDLYEYMLSKIATAGQNGQFRTPRHIIKLMVDMVAPQPTDEICDPACGNLEFFNQDLPGSEGSLKKSLNQRLFETRLGLITELDTRDKPEGEEPPEGSGTETERGLRFDIARQLHTTVAGMNLENFLVRPHRQLVEHYAQWSAWTPMSAEAAEKITENLAGLPSTHKDDEEDAKRFDLLVLRRQLAQLQGDAGAAERLREQVQNIANGLLGKTTIPSVAAQHELLDEVASDQWWVDVTLPMLEVARRRLRGLLQFLDKGRKDVVYTSFQDELTESTIVELPGITPGTDWERFRAKAAAYLKQHQDHVALQRLRRNKTLTPDDLKALEQMLVDSGAGDAEVIARAKEQSHGLGLFIRSLVGLDRQAALEAFARYLDGTRFNANQLHFINLIVDELTANGVMEAARLYESPYRDYAATGPESMFTEGDVDNIVDILNAVRANALPADQAM